MMSRRWREEKSKRKNRMIIRESMHKWRTIWKKVRLLIHSLEISQQIMIKKISKRELRIFKLMIWKHRQMRK
jgi:hypothetical protein